jgi:surface antigen
MKHLLSFFILLLTSVHLVACNSMTNQDVGTLSGAVAGGLLGSTVGKGSGQMLAVAAGTLAGAYLGGAVGKNMDETDRLKMNHALESNSIGQPAYWRNTNTGTNYEVTPTRNLTVSGNPYCREYRTIAYIAGKRQQMYGTACRRPDGSWEMQS